jgi:diacylglycerol kinase family enzyme
MPDGRSEDAADRLQGSISNGGAPSRRQWVGVAANAHSGIGSGRERVGRLVSELERRGLESRVAWTLDQRRQLVAEAHSENDCRCLVAAGGDGTVAALINEQPAVPITVLASGTENLFARHFGMRKRPEYVAKTIARGTVTRIDLGRVADRRFALMAGVGFDADVVTRHHRARLGHAGVPRPTHRAAYVESVLKSSLAYRFPPLTVTITDPGREESFTGAMAFVFNLPRYALGLPIAPDARGDDGLLDLVVFRDAGPFRALHYLWMVFRGIHLRRSGVHHRRVARVAISSAESVPVQLDGDPGGIVNGHPQTWTAEVVPGAVEVMVPSRHLRRH